MQLLREIAKPIFRYLKDAEYREYLHVRSKCRNATPGSRCNVTVFGFRLDVINPSAFLHLYEEIMLRKAFDISFSYSTPFIVCAGANAGLELFFLKKKYPDARILAFEADPVYAQLLKKNIEANGLTNTEVRNEAVWIEKGSIAFLPDGGLGGKIVSSGNKINSIRFSDEFQNEKSIDLLLMDIEGVEMKVLLDSRNLLLKTDHLFVEWHGKENEAQDLPILLQLLSESGFRYRLNNNLQSAPFLNRTVESGFDAMVEIYAERK